MQTQREGTNGFDLRKQEGKIVMVFVAALLVYIVFILLGDFKKIKAVILHFNWYIIPPLLVLTLLNYLVRALRFQYYLRTININISFKQALLIFLSGLSMTVTPGKTGEIIKAYLLKRSHNTSITHVVPMLIFERMTDGIAMIFLGFAGLFFVRQSILFFVFAILSVIVFILIIKLQRYILHLLRMLEKLLPKVKILHFFEIFFENADKLLTGRNFAVGILLGMLAWSFEGISLALLVNQFISLNLFYNLAISLFIFSFSSIAGFFVFIPAGIGVAEGSITYFLTYLFPLTLSSAVFITLLFRFITLWFGVGLGISVLLYMLRRNKE